MQNNKVEDVLKRLDIVIKAIEKDNGLANYNEFAFLKTELDSYENKITKLFKQQGKFYANGIRGYNITKANSKPFQGLIGWLNKKLFGMDKFQQQVQQVTEQHLTNVIHQINKELAPVLDPDIEFDGRLTKQTEKFIKNWSIKLGNIMQVNTQFAIKRIIRNGMKNELTIDQIADKLEKLPQFDRTRANRVATTETLTAAEVGKHEAYTQSPAVVGRIWKHHSSSHARDWHESYDGTMKPLGEAFELDGESCMYPRDTSLSAHNRVNCRCSTSPYIDTEIKDNMDATKKAILRDKVLRGK